MMTHPLITQLRFTRSELRRALDGVSDADARCRLEPMNCISWMVGHLANQEHYYWVMLTQSKTVAPGLNDLVGYGKPASTPPLAEMWAAWHTVTQAADPYLDTLTPEVLQTHFERNGKPLRNPAYADHRFQCFGRTGRLVAGTDGRHRLDYAAKVENGAFYLLASRLSIKTNKPANAPMPIKKTPLAQ